MPINLLFDLVNYTPADASPVQANLQQIEQYLNQEVITRDGLVAMQAALRLFNSTPVNDLDAASKGYVDLRNPHSAIVATNQSTASGAFTDLATVGPVVTLETGTLVRVTIVALVTTGGDSLDNGQMAVAVSGATTIAAAAGWGATVVSVSFAPAGQRQSLSFLVQVIAGANTFTMKYRKGAGPSANVSFADRVIVVERLN